MPSTLKPLSSSRTAATRGELLVPAFLFPVLPLFFVLCPSCLTFCCRVSCFREISGFRKTFLPYLKEEERGDGVSVEDQCRSIKMLGVNTPHIMIGVAGSMTDFHVEDYNFASVNYCCYSMTTAPFCCVILLEKHFCLRSCFTHLCRLLFSVTRHSLTHTSCETLQVSLSIVFYKRIERIHPLSSCIIGIFHLFISTGYKPRSGRCFRFRASVIFFSNNLNSVLPLFLERTSFHPVAFTLLSIIPPHYIYLHYFHFFVVFFNL